MTSEKTLVSSDGETFKVSESAAGLSVFIKHMIEDCTDNTIRLGNVNGRILAKVTEYCKRHANSKGADEDMKAFDKEFMEVDMDTLYHLLLAANYLDIKSLLDLTCQTVADMIKGKTSEEIREKFNIKNDFTPEEEAEVRKENAWAFE